MSKRRLQHLKTPFPSGDRGIFVVRMVFSYLIHFVFHVFFVLLQRKSIKVTYMGINLKTYYYRLSIICCLLSLTLALQAQTTRQLKVYLKGGVVDEVKVDANASLRHSRIVNNQEQSDYVTMVVTDAEGYEHPYLISQVDSLVLPSGQRVVFMGCMQSQPRRSSFSGNFPGEGVGNVTFYWTENDHIRLDAGYESRALNLTNDKTNASFVFEDLNTDATSYMVYFPDKIVTIPTVQTQSGADNTDHIGRSGDCGTAEATLTFTPQSLTPNYSFTLQHKAAYLCFLPIIDHLPSVKVTKIQLSCNEAIAGTYQLSLTGLYNPANTSKKIMLDLNAQRPRVFFLGHQIITEQDMCAAYMVIAPQTAKRNFTVTYFLTDTLSRLTTTYQQKFSFQPVANTVYPVVCHIPESLFQSIDLGFDHLWSNVNLGSNIPNEAGNYYAWGEVTSKGDFSSSNYTANVSSEVLDICGTEYDPVSQSSLGSSWQMPTADEMDELIDLCHWEWTEYNGAEGWLVTGTNNGNDDVEPQRIFLPMTGYKNGSITQQPSQGYYWLGTREDAVNGNASALVLSRESKQKALMQGWQGMNIRPVKAIWREFNILRKSMQYIDLRSHGPGYNIKVYDYGGPNDNYGNNDDGYLQITCADGYKLNITGSVDTEGSDHLYCYDVTENGDEDLWLNMAGNGTTNVERKYLQRLIDNGMSKFRFYDYAGKNDNYGNNVDGYMLVDAPVGYVMQIDCSTSLEGSDHLYLYDGYNSSFQCLMDPHGSGNTTTHNNAVFAHFHTDGSIVFSGYDCLVTLKPDEVEQFNIPHNTVVDLTEEHMTWLLNTKGLTTMKVYDSGGPNGNYDNSANGSLIFRLPQGYRMHVYGTSNTENSDHMKVYDTDGVKVDVAGQNKTIDYTTTSNYLRLQLITDGSVIYSGVDLTVDFIRDGSSLFLHVPR